VVKLLEAAGFGGVQHELLSGGISQLYLGTRLPLEVTQPLEGA
jgi:hypothetical protein